jgi:dephospho-CoA kinase
MPSIGITGGIASGKTTFRKLLLQRIDAEFLDTDQCAHALMASDPTIKNRIAAEVSDVVFDPTGAVDRTALRDIIFRDDSKRKTLEQILHPIIRDQWVAAAGRAKQMRRTLVIEIPLLFETQSETHLDRTVAVACPPSRQLHRLTENRKLAPETARKILASQLGLAVKMTRSDHVIWNDGPTQFLEAQADLLASFLNSTS